MAKKSRPPVKVESEAVVKEETRAVKEETPASGKEREGIDAVLVLMAIG